MSCLLEPGDEDANKAWEGRDNGVAFGHDGRVCAVDEEVRQAEGLRTVAEGASREAVEATGPELVTTVWWLVPWVERERRG